MRWPTLAAAPTHFLLTGKSAELDRISAALIDEQQSEERREQANLLYVALTRAKQLLFISGCQPQRSDELGWYGLIAAQLGEVPRICQEGWHRQQGTPPPAAPLAARITPLVSDIDPRLNVPLVAPPPDIEISPSRHATSDDDSYDGDEDGRERGRAIHRFLELLCGEPRRTPQGARGQVAPN